MTGLTSITFRGLSIDEIISLTKKADLKGIEWGSDVHVRPGDTKLAVETGRKTRDVGVDVLPYGSYFKAGLSDNNEILPLLDSAAALETKVIRVWAGSGNPQTAGSVERAKTVDSLQHFVEAARPYNIQIATEYHRYTFTENAESALQLMQEVPGLLSYWQPNPDISDAENWKELNMMLPYLLNVHVFEWKTPGNTRYPLADGEEIWKQYIRLAESSHQHPHHYMLEFVKDDRTEQCLEDAKALNRWMQEVQGV